MLIDERLKEFVKSERADGPRPSWQEWKDMARELLAIRERGVDLPTLLRVMREESCRDGGESLCRALGKHVAYGDGVHAPKPERRHSEAEVRQAVVDSCEHSTASTPEEAGDDVLRRLRGEGEARPHCPKCGKALASFAHLPGVWRCMNDDCDRWDVHPSEVGGATP